MKIKVVFANVTHGFIYADHLKDSPSMVFTKFSIPDYVQYFEKNNPDILCLSEVLMDDFQGNSEFIDELSEATDLKNVRVLCSGESFLYIGKYYGLAILSRFPINHYEEIKLPNPKLKVIRPNGDFWEMHDKYIQFCKLNIKENLVNLFNLHYFPVHHFKKSIVDEDLKSIREEFCKDISSRISGNPTIITGDFNNKGTELVNVFPDLFIKGKMKESVIAKTTIVDGKDQLDHILYTEKSLSLLDSFADKFLSDHFALISTFHINNKNISKGI